VCFVPKEPKDVANRIATWKAEAAATAKEFPATAAGKNTWRNGTSRGFPPLESSNFRSTTGFHGNQGTTKNYTKRKSAVQQIYQSEPQQV